MDDITTIEDLKYYEGVLLREISRGAKLGYRDANKNLQFYYNPNANNTITCKSTVRGETEYFEGKAAVSILMQDANFTRVVSDYTIGREKETLANIPEELQAVVGKRKSQLEKITTEYRPAYEDKEVNEDVIATNNINLSDRVAAKMAEGMSFEEAWGTVTCELKLEVAQPTLNNIRREDNKLAGLSELVYAPEEEPDIPSKRSEHEPNISRDCI